jgi:hypothetical protein
MNVQVRLTPATAADRPDSYEAVACPACARLHLINKVTGKVLGDKEQQ